MTSAPRGDSAPEGFVAVDVGGPFLASTGPLHAGWVDGALRLGLRIESRHCNPARVCHGGMLATFADMMLPYAAMHALRVARRFTPTVSLHTDFVAPAPLGAWLEGGATHMRSTRTMLFVQGAAWADGALVMHASGVFKWGAPVTDGDPHDPFGVRPRDGP